MSVIRSKIFQAQSIAMVNKNLMLTAILNCVDTDSLHIGIGVNTALPAVARNGLSEE
jgi:hypothetical protein